MQKTLTDLADEIIARLQPTYDLVYVDRDDKFSNKQVAFLVKGDFESLWESTGEWESDNRWESCKQVIAGLAQDVVRDWTAEIEDGDDSLTEQELPHEWSASGARCTRRGCDVTSNGDDNGPCERHPDYPEYESFAEDLFGTDEWERVRYEVEERDSSDWAKDLARGCNNVLLRIPVEAMSEDAGLSFREVGAAEVLSLVGFKPTEANIKSVQYALDNASPEFNVNMGYWVAGVNVSDLLDLDGDPEATVRITNPYLYIGNPFAGSGFVTEEALTGEVTLARGDLRTDADAFGVSINEIYGGVYASSFEVEIRDVPAEPEPVEPKA